MAIIYHVIIKATKKENVFHIKWIDHKKASYRFEQSSVDIAPEEMEWMWKDRRNQLGIGEKLFRFLDGDGYHLQRALKEASNHDEILRLHIATCRETDNWPFELLARDSSFLPTTQLHLVRWVPVQESVRELPPQNRRLRLLFMACSPPDVQPELDFEKEEEAIFKITERLAVDMEVEDSGTLGGLREKLEQQQYDIVHLSGYADIDKKGQPFFVMENETGYRQDVSANELWNRALKLNPPRLFFLSGNRTGDAPEGTEGAFAHMLVKKYRIPAVLGWGRPVSDVEANEAAEMMYKELSRGKSVLHAVQRARYHLINSFPSTLEPAWPLLRLFSSGSSLSAIVEKEQIRQPQMRRMTHIYLRNSQVKVLGEGFVGRRRQLQQSLQVLKLESRKVGLLILGTGGLGKSCLAGKVIERSREHTLITVHGKLNAITLKQALTDAFIISQDDHGKNVLSREMEMREILGVLCRSCFKNKKYLILLDDFEQNLEGSEKGKPDCLLPETAELLKVLLDCLPETGKTTQVIITCRYVFSFEVDGRDLVSEQLEFVWLTGFRESEQKKKVRELPHISEQKEPSTVNKLLTAGCGNPRLMEWLDVLVGQMKPSGVPELLKAVSNKKEDFIRKHVIRELLCRGGEELTRFIHWFAIFRSPVLEEGAKAVCEKAGLKRWNDLLHRGMDLSLIEYDRARLSFQGTPLLREEFLKEFANLHNCHEAAFAYYKSICDGEPDEQFDPLLVEEWIYHALGCGEEEIASEQGNLLTKYFRHALAFLESERLGLWILEQKKKELSTDHDASLLNSLSITISKLGDNRRAVNYCQEALTISKELFGPEHPRVAVELNNLGEVWRALGKPKKAIEYFQKALTIYKMVSKREHPGVGNTLNNLGTAWGDLGNPRKSIDYYKEALAIYEVVYGREHPDMGITFSNLGMAWDTLGDYSKAIGYYQDALNLHEAVYGREHPAVATGLNNIGMAYQSLGYHKKAIVYYQEAVTINETIYGRQHPDVATGLNNVGMACQAMGDHRKASDFFRESLAIFEALFEPGHPKIANGLNNLGTVCQDSGDPSQAIGYFSKALAIDEAAFGRKHPKVTSDWNNLGLAWQELGDPKKAIDYYQKSLDVDELLFGREHPMVARDLNNLGGAWDDLGDSRKAIEYYQEALAVDKAIFGLNHPQVAYVLSNIGMAWLALGEQNKAIGYLEQALRINKTLFEPGHPDVGNVLNNLGLAWDELGEFQKAIGYYKQALIIDKAVFGGRHSRVATELNNLGAAWNALGNHRKAVDYCQEALVIDEVLFGRQHPNVARDLSNLGVVYFKLVQIEKAKDHFEEAYAIYNKLFGPEHPDTKIVVGWLEKIKKRNRV